MMGILSTEKVYSSILSFLFYYFKFFTLLCICFMSTRGHELDKAAPVLAWFLGSTIVQSVLHAAALEII